jgi:hypothetical protein
LKGIITEQDWESWKDDIYVDYVKDNHFTELKEMEVYRERAGLLNEMSGFVGEFISKEWAMRNIMRFSDDDIKDIEKEIKGEVASGEVEDPKEPEPKEEPPQQKDSPNDEGDK